MACCGYLTCNQKLWIHTRHIKKLISKLYSFALRRKITTNNNRSEVSLDTGCTAGHADWRASAANFNKSCHRSRFSRRMFTNFAPHSITASANGFLSAACTLALTDKPFSTVGQESARANGEKQQCVTAKIRSLFFRTWTVLWRRLASKAL